jgi:transglutaminase-like putative cysteine protease
VKIRIGYDIAFECPRPTPMFLMLNVHYSRVAQLIKPDHLMTDPALALTGYRDSFGNWCTRLVAPPGLTRIFTDTTILDSGLPDRIVPDAKEVPLQDLPEETLLYLLGSRYCETDRLSDEAWHLFGQVQPGWPRVQAICDFVHKHIRFGYQFARRTRSAREAWDEGVGVCRDYAHLAITLCRCMNIPARYCTGYLGDIGVPPAAEPMDFAGWFEAYLGGQWHTFDARNNTPRIGRVLIARGRDAADVAIATTFGPNMLRQFHVRTEEVADN